MESFSESITVGLCSTCNNSPDCTYRALRGSDALCCEMFDDYFPMPPGRIGLGGVLLAPRMVQTETSDLKGLCVNCENRSACRQAQSEGGIWHCEEYL